MFPAKMNCHIRYAIRVSKFNKCEMCIAHNVWHMDGGRGKCKPKSLLPCHEKPPTRPTYMVRRTRWYCAGLLLVDVRVVLFCEITRYMCTVYDYWLPCTSECPLNYNWIMHFVCSMFSIHFWSFVCFVYAAEVGQGRWSYTISKVRPVYSGDWDK